MKSSCSDSCVALEVHGIVDNQGRLNKRCSVKDAVPTLRSEAHGNQPKAVLEVEVKEATKQGHAVARGGVRCSQLHVPKQQAQKGESRGRYGEHIRNAMQSRDIR